MGHYLGPVYAVPAFQDPSRLFITTFFQLYLEHPELEPTRYPITTGHCLALLLRVDCELGTDDAVDLG